jgi:hypothetical protein
MEIMTEQQLDSQGEARDALSSIVADFGPRVLSDPRMLSSRMSDLLPDLPKERQLLITAAEADVAGDLTRHVQEEHLDPNTAVQLVAGSLTDRKSIDPASSMWVAAEYAQALGYRVQPGAMPPPSRPFSPPPPPGPETVTTYGGQQGPTIGAPQGYGGYGQPQPPTGGGGYGQPQPPPGVGGYGQPQPPPGVGGYYPQQPAGGAAPPQQGTPGWVQPPPGNRRNRGRIYGIGAAAAAVVIILGVGFGTNWFSGKSTNAASTHITHPPKTPVTSTTAAPKPTTLPLVQLLPGDVDDPATQCQSYPSPDWNTTGATGSYECVDPGLPGNNNDVFAFQFDTYAHYLASWAAFNQVINFTSISKGSSCPPPSGDAAGTTQWKNQWFPYRDGQVLECGTIGSGSTEQPEYIWTFPTENAYVWARGGPGTTMSSLDKWWSNNPMNTPTPTP